MNRIMITLTCTFLLAAAGLRAEMRVTHVEAVRAAVKRPNPEYGPLAKQMRIEGEVEVEVHITATGDVDGVKVVSGNPLLTTGVTKTVREWKFNPFQEDGKPASATATMRFSFKM